jgi:hypothetical protein
MDLAIVTLIAAVIAVVVFLLRLPRADREVLSQGAAGPRDDREHDARGAGGHLHRAAGDSGAAQGGGDGCLDEDHRDRALGQGRPDLQGQHARRHQGQILRARQQDRRRRAARGAVDRLRACIQPGHAGRPVQREVLGGLEDGRQVDGLRRSVPGARPVPRRDRAPDRRRFVRLRAGRRGHRLSRADPAGEARPEQHPRCAGHQEDH